MSDSTFDNNAETPPAHNTGQPEPQPGTEGQPAQDGTQGIPAQPEQLPYQQYPGQAQQPYQQAPGQYQQGYQQAPGQPYQPYQQVPGQQGYQPYQQGYQQSYQPYQQAPGQNQQGYQQGYQQPYQPYTPMPASPYQQPVQPAKRKVWPWVLAGCLIFALLSLGGCVSCVACSVMSYEGAQSSSGYSYDYPYDYDYNYDYDDLYDYFNDDGSTYDDPYSYTFTKDELEELKAEEKGSVENGVCTTGMYEVGTGKDIEPGLYYLSGSQTDEGAFVVFTKGSNGEYEVGTSVVYYGNYFADLEEGSYIMFDDPDGATMCLAEKSDFKPEGPTYQSGCYRVGIDIPAGTYKASYVSDAVLDEATQESGVYVMDNLDWDDESIVESYNLIAGSGPTITVKDGQYVELYAASMSPVSA